MVCPSVCRLSQFSFNVPVLALNSVTLDAVLLYKSCSSLIVCLNFLYIDIVLLSCISFIQRESSHDFTSFLIFDIIIYLFLITCILWYALHLDVLINILLCFYSVFNRLG